MKENNKYKQAIIGLKKYIKSINLNKRDFNYLFLNIRKGKYEILYEKFKYFGTNLVYIKIIETSEYKYLLERNRDKRKSILQKINYINKICNINNEITKYKAIKLMEPIYLEYIINYNNYYENFINIFKDLDKNIGKEIVKLKNSKEYIFNELHSDHFGLGMYIRNHYIFKKNHDVKYIFGSIAKLIADDISTEILNGYRFYKLGIFEIFKSKMAHRLTGR